ncbi:Gp37Gp68 family protein [Mycolicibacterium rhodesiae JS60]|nr:Gp37Gp68 family protein [Mycolicibacterium rhodesiae JS60]
MAARSKIEWTNSSWGAVSGCTKVSPGCANCYAEAHATRFAGTKAWPNGFDVTLWPKRLDQPLRWRAPRKVFVCSTADLFHSDVPDEHIAKVWATMALSPRHTYQVLTKRPARMQALLRSRAFNDLVFEALGCDELVERRPEGLDWDLAVQRFSPKRRGAAAEPLPNLWLGVSAENQHWADIRIPLLLGTLAVVRFVSLEPLLGPIDLRQALGKWMPPQRHPAWQGDTLHARDMLHWVIAGGESGRRARPMHPDWARSLRDQCQKAGIAFLFKQWGEWQPLDGREPQDGDAVVLADPWNPLNRRDESGQPEAWTPWNRDLHGTGESMFGAAVLRRVGKTKAGRLLDGQLWDEFPVVPEAAAS